LESLSVNIVVRLCTQELRVLEYWNKVKHQLAPDTINILKDLHTEAQDIHKINAWVTYSEAVHRFRELGMNSTDFNALAEHLLTPRQLRLVCSSM
jgi:hypothetical protein